MLIFILISCGSCLLSILAHPIIVQLDIQERTIAEICIGEIYYQGDPGPINRQGIWVASPFLPNFSVSLMNSTGTNKVICGVIPWSRSLPYFKMIVIHPFFEIYPYW
jgi:hypothetical protein